MFAFSRSLLVLLAVGAAICSCAYAVDNSPANTEGTVIVQEVKPESPAVTQELKPSGVKKYFKPVATAAAGVGAAALALAAIYIGMKVLGYKKIAAGSEEAAGVVADELLDLTPKAVILTDRFKLKFSVSYPPEFKSAAKKLSVEEKKLAAAEARWLLQTRIRELKEQEEGIWDVGILGMPLKVYVDFTPIKEDGADGALLE